MSQIKDHQYIYILLSNQQIIKNYKANADILLLENPFEFCIKKYAVIINILEVIKDAIMYEAYVEISLEEYTKYHKYQCGALDLIFSGRLLASSYSKIDINKPK